MTISNRLRLNLLLSVGVVIILGLAFFLAIVKQEKAIAQNSVAFQFMDGAYELNLISSYYLRHPEERPKAQWRVKHDSLMKELKSMSNQAFAKEVIINRMTDNLANSDKLFNELVATYEQSSSKPSISRHPAETAKAAKIKQLSDLMAMRSHEIALDAARLVKNNYLEIENFNKLISRLTIVLVWALLLIVLWQAKSLTKKINAPIARLRAGTDFIGEGNLDYRIGIAATDELGQLSAAFDTMTERLQKDIAVRTRAEAEREQFHKFFLNSADIMVIADPNGSFLKVNPACVEQLGYSEEELVSKPFIDFVHPDDKQPTLEEMVRQQIIGTSFAFVNRYICKDGSIRWLSWRAVYNKDENCSYATARDITDNKRQAEALLKSEQAFRELAEAMPQIVWITRADGWTIYFNQQWMDYTGLTLEESLGHGWNKPFHHDDQQVAWEAWQNATGKLATYSLECRLRRADGVYKWWLVRAVPVFDEQGAVAKWFGTCTDIDDFKKAEEERLSLEKQLLHAQKLESLGILAGGIAHDFNNILMAIIGNAELARMKLTPESPIMTNLQQIELASMRAADLAKQMLAYSGKGKFLIVKLDMNRLLEEMVPMLEVSISRKSLLRLKLAPTLPAVEADATQIHQIIMNLVINASEAIGDEGGFITVTTGSMECTASYLKQLVLNENAAAGVYVYLEITDTGCGMDKETQGRIFDPFFTTKFTGRGLGMAAVHGIVRGHKGGINIYSEPGKGTTFKVLLPASGSFDENVKKVSPHDDWQGSGTVLLVDDEEMIRDVGAEMLKSLGFTVISANDGIDALEVFKSSGDIDCVILDLTMPHMDGEQCFHELRQLYPEVKVIMSSGYSEDEVAEKFSGMGVNGFIQKPFNLSAFKEVLKGALS